MKRVPGRRVILLIIGALISGCSGYDRVLFATKTNVGLDIDTQPPTAEVTIARRELMIQPIFPDYDDHETALPMMASFGFQGNFINPRITAHFAGGEAAVNLAKEVKPEDETSNKRNGSSICLERRPADPRGAVLKFWHYITRNTTYRNEPRPFYFATDSSYGVKVAWSGTAGPTPDTLKLGYNRKEFASPPIFVEKGCKNGKISTEDEQKYWEVKLPSFYAAIENESGFSSIPYFGDSKVEHVQFFATGEAATNFTTQAAVRQHVFDDLAPRVAEAETARLGLNQALIREIESSFSSADDTKKEKIITEAKRVKLVADEATEADFVARLNKKSNVPSPIVSRNLNSLRLFASN